MPPPHFSFAQSLRVIFAIGWSDFVLKYRGSILGYFWSFIGPLTKFLVILVIFGPYVSASIPQYPLYLFLGIIVWEYFILTTNGCMVVLYEKEGLVQRHPFPRILLILSVGWTNTIIFATHLFIFFVFAWFFGAPVDFAVLLLPVAVFQLTLISLGTGMLLSAYCLKYRDISHLWSIASQILFWLTPIMYPYRAANPMSASVVSFFSSPGLHPFRRILDMFIHFQPVSIVINDFRRLTLYSAAWGVPTMPHLIAFTLISLGIFLAGKKMFDMRSPYFAQEY
ncbi:hypothetical protein A3A67_03345 [Candidatus Peribacteria bacterium RIFCSPLOWO2_01_FULL_51_18]|nr:MAG: hypothetical protein A3A67_03345 [Candidatus Peribacteria bacterium RIFCSPLOWO2_01_FULL_51_18]OGJ68308.1 MAG: hypothetical protein A3J34_04070 [Candidatus Peribacteria bacterium RIFCSPLOWO2_02_FULL_51_10]